MKILLVDDNANNLSLLEELLRLEGHEVVTAANGHAALTRMAQSRPDVVLCDLLMPGMSGEALLAFLAGDPRWAGVKPVVLTGAGGPPGAACAAQAVRGRRLVEGAGAGGGRG
jgi:CheY-like chemotaxis protein